MSTSVTEITPDMPTATVKPLTRSVCATSIAMLLWAVKVQEDGLGESSYADATPRPFIELGELVTNMALEPERVEIAVMCMADTVCQGEYVIDNMSILDASVVTRRRLLRVAQAALNTFRENLKDVPPDGRYRDDMARLLDVVAPKDVMR